MTDLWANRITLNPDTPVMETAGEHGVTDLDGSLDRARDSGMTAKVIDVTAAKEMPGPKNPASTWSADNPY